MRTYQTGIQEIVFNIIKESNKRKKEYITKQQIVKEAKKTLGDNPNINMKVGQALNTLQKRTTFKRPRIKKVFHEEIKRNIGWTLADEKIESLWKEAL